MSISEKRVDELNKFCMYLAYMKDPVFSSEMIPFFVTDGNELFLKVNKNKKKHLINVFRDSDWKFFRYDLDRKSLTIILAESVQRNESSFVERVWEHLSDFVSDEALAKLKAHENEIRNGVEFEEYDFDDWRERSLDRLNSKTRYAELRVVFENSQYIDAHVMTSGLRSETCRRYRKYKEEGRTFVVVYEKYRIYEDKWTYDTKEDGRK